MTLRSLSREAFAASGLSFTYAFHDTPFGEVIALVCDGALAGLGFSPDRKDALADMQRRWPKARFVEKAGAGQDFVKRVFNPQNKDTVPLLLIGGELDRAVWEALLSIPAGSFTSYGALAEKTRETQSGARHWRGRRAQPCLRSRALPPRAGQRRCPDRIPLGAFNQTGLAGLGK